jgi:hypothetical protein
VGIEAKAPRHAGCPPTTKGVDARLQIMGRLDQQSLPQSLLEPHQVNGVRRSRGNTEAQPTRTPLGRAGTSSRKLRESTFGTVATKNSESREKSRVLGRTAVVSPVCLSTFVPLSPLLPADSAVGPILNWRTSLSVIS